MDRIIRPSLLPTLLLLILSLFTTSALSDADFASVRQRLTKDHSGKAGDPREKYFHESTFHPHYDGRFAEKQLDYKDRRTHLLALMRSYVLTMADLGAETWLMHGTLMGWWWNEKILPWDSDIDVQMTLDTMSFLYSYYNLGVYHFSIPGVEGGRDYMLEINPGFAKLDPKYDRLNSIDARWIDMDSGIFIDITAVRPNETARANGIDGALMCKDKHKYLEKDIFPLRDSWFEGLPVKIPNEYVLLLEEEYSKASLTRTVFERHKWNETTGQWDPLAGATDPLPEKRPQRHGSGPGPGRRPRRGGRKAGPIKSGAPLTAVQEATVKAEENNSQNQNQNTGQTPSMPREAIRVSTNPPPDNRRDNPS